MAPDQAVIDRWTGAAPFWEKHRDLIVSMFAPFTNGLVEDARIGSGQTVLDIATGPGEPALSLIPVVGPTGKVFGIDPIPGMVDAARRAAERRGIGNAQFDVAFADALPFADGTFDAVVSRFGTMFFPSPLDAVREILRVLKPGGRLALAVWDAEETSAFFYALRRVIDRHFPSPPPDPDAPDAFRFAPPGKLRAIVDQAGAAGTSERVLQCAIQAPLLPEEFWTLRCEMSEKICEKVTALPAEQLELVKREAIEALREFASADGMSFPAQARIVTATKR